MGGLWLWSQRVVLRGEGVLEGFELPVADLFAELKLIAPMAREWKRRNADQKE